MENTNYINNENVKSILSIGDWSVSEDYMSGTIEWNHPSKSTTILATPNWEEEGLVPIDMANEDGDYKKIIDVVLSGSIKEQMNQYETIVESVLANI
jgi:hypothetical protein|tara:strand:+ start:1412 stop:1702 length:291 start_codon:yes stop_codon:yes gene_type:complete